MNYIKPSTCTQFPIGSKVKIIDKGQAFTSYIDMVVYMKVRGMDGSYTECFNPLQNGNVVTVIAKAMHEQEYYGEVLAVRFGLEGAIGLIRATGVVEFEPEPEPTVAELLVELATTKAKLWEAEWKLNKMVAIATE